MRIAFVGKGGSGKTTLTALFTNYLDENTENNIWLVDADLNIHIANLLGIEEVEDKKHLSSKNTQIEIKEYLKGNNQRVKSIGHFKKTTPPSKESNLIDLRDENNFLFKNFTTNLNNTYLSIVGTYQEDGIGTSCYHNNLSILENVLSHSIDKDSYIVIDMVAGIDAFAGTLHSQFDLLVLSVEPTKRSVDVYKQYRKLAAEAGVESQLFVVGNKVRNEKDKNFISINIPENKLIGFVEDSEHIRNVDQEIESLTVSNLDNGSINALKAIKSRLDKNRVSPNKRLKHLIKLHKKYVNQAYVKDRFGDLTNQIDQTFNFEDYQ
jgi:CO dehydrogenase maturation factor